MRRTAFSLIRHGWKFSKPPMTPFMITWWRYQWKIGCLKYLDQTLSFQGVVHIIDLGNGSEVGLSVKHRLPDLHRHWHCVGGPGSSVEFDAHRGAIHNHTRHICRSRPTLPQPGWLINFYKKTLQEAQPTPTHEIEYTITGVTFLLQIWPTVAVGGPIWQKSTCWCFSGVMYVS